MRCGDEFGGSTRHAHLESVEEHRVHDLVTGVAQLRGDRERLRTHPLGDAAQPVGPVVDPVHARHDGEQHLGGADVRGGLVAADVLLPGLQREAVGGAAVGVARDSDEAAGHLALETFAHGEIAGVRPAEAHGHAEPLRRADRDVGTELARGRHERQGEQVGGDDRKATRLAHGGDDERGVPHAPRRGRVLHEDAEGRRQVGRVDVGERQHDEVDVERLGPTGEHGVRLRERVGVDDEPILGDSGCSSREQHALDDRRRLVEHRRVRGVQACEVGDHGLKVEQRLQPPLRDLGLVGRVGGVPARVLEHVALNDRGRDGAVVALPDHAAPHGVVVGERTQLGERLGFGRGSRQGAQRLLLADRVRHGGIHQGRERVVAEGVEHEPLRIVVGADMTLGEGDAHVGLFSVIRLGGAGVGRCCVRWVSRR